MAGLLGQFVRFEENEKSSEQGIKIGLDEFEIVIREAGLAFGISDDLQDSINLMGQNRFGIRLLRQEWLGAHFYCLIRPIRVHRHQAQHVIPVGRFEIDNITECRRRLTIHTRRYGFRMPFGSCIQI